MLPPDSARAPLQPNAANAVEGGNNNAAAAAAAGEVSLTVAGRTYALHPKRNAVQLVVSAALLGFAQLLAWLGRGAVDPWTSPLSILQFTVFIDFGIQLVAGVPAAVVQMENFYDAVGSLTYLTCVSYSLAAGYYAGVTKGGNTISPHAFAASAMVYVWALRLGWYLSRRGIKYGDSRFDEIKRDPVRFVTVWFVQGLWVFITSLPVFILNASQTAPRGFVWSDAVGGALFLIGFAFEAIGDYQKSVWRERKDRGKFISEGVWFYSRHPNHFGEWVLQFGIFVFCAGSFKDSQWIAVIQPVFLFILLRFVSGVNLLESKADEKLGSDPEYQAYKASTSMCVPLPKLSGPAPSWLLVV